MSQPEYWNVDSTLSSPARHHRHQVSLEDVLDFSSADQTPLSPAERQRARATFDRIVAHYESIDPFRALTPAQHSTSYSRPLLIRNTYEYALSDEARDIFLRAFFGALALDIAGANSELDLAELAPLFTGFAEYLMDNFFLPVKASTRKTPQPTPAFHSAVMQAQASGTAEPVFISTTDRLAALRGACLVRDRHRCVVSRKFDMSAFIKRVASDGDNACDDDDVLFTAQDQLQYQSLEVAHILPHSLMKADTEAGGMNKSREAALAVLDMFDKGVVHLINGVDIDRPSNALSLTLEIHRKFGAFEIFFEPVAGEYNTYRIQSFLPAPLDLIFGLPVTRALFVTKSRSIDPPSPRLLAVHRAIAHILHLSGAGWYIDNVLREMEENAVRSDGTTDLARMVNFGLSGWAKGTVH